MIKLLFIGILVLTFLGEIYTIHLLKKITKKNWVVVAYIFVLLIIFGGIFYYFNQVKTEKGQTAQSMQILAFLLFFTLPKILFSLVLFLEDIFRLSKWITTKYFLKRDVSNKRNVFLLRTVLTLSAITAVCILYGIFIGKYNYQVRNQSIEFANLPQSFDGLKILQLSDFHTGSWDNEEAIRKGIEKINQQDFDLLVFTGDFVNNKAEEAQPWIPFLQQIKTPRYGKYAILGNHDYGEYVNWSSDFEKEKNFRKIKENIQKSGFQLLLNENIPIVNQQDTIHLLGVENWGKNFKQVGDLKKATDSISKDAFKIVLTHDPSHWYAEIVGHVQDYQLTLSGHTHGLQFGIKLLGWEWSPSQWFYPQWGGLYQHKRQYLYVNRGFGFHAYSGRVGIMPEITVLELKKGK
ncbi:metallophosphoesterase [Capnocytophaga sp. ARDL2]|uniref:metallophosphoesterase n=1 Tax=Capnocytophaga sp. ARDL2 TaxID=3238809 RepID=UPI00355884EB